MGACQRRRRHGQAYFDIRMKPGTAYAIQYESRLQRLDMFPDRRICPWVLVVFNVPPRDRARLAGFDGDGGTSEAH